MDKFYLLCFLFFKLLFYINSLKCKNRTIEHCNKCASGINGDTCAQCEDTYFPLYANLNCIKCDDEIEGQKECGGKCDSSKYSTIYTVLCEENGCKEGYYNIDGICFECSIGSEHCTNCTYIAPLGSQKKKFKCLLCEGGLYGIYRIWESDGKCHTCDGLIPNCIQCHYENGTNKAICDKCVDDYYVDPITKSKCNKCYNDYITGGEC